MLLPVRAVCLSHYQVEQEVSDVFRNQPALIKEFQIFLLSNETEAEEAGGLETVSTVPGAGQASLSPTATIPPFVPVHSEATPTTPRYARHACVHIIFSSRECWGIFHDGLALFASGGAVPCA